MENKQLEQLERELKAEFGEKSNIFFRIEMCIRKVKASDKTGKN